ncbi:hypothetical protein RP20_CCG001951 [Aedes albopictus]|nr:hypothetical protein RP20_CCG001951 [Aedes albopictus]
MYDQAMEYNQGYMYGAMPQDYFYQSQSGQMGYQFQQDPTAYYQNYQAVQQTPQMYPSVQCGNTLDYQMTPALYVLNQQAKILEKSLLPGMIDQPISSKPKRRKQRGPYKKKNATSPSPAPVIEQFENPHDLTVQGCVRRRNSSEEYDVQMYQPVTKQIKTSEDRTMANSKKVSIFRCVELLAQSSVNRPC